MPTIVDKDGIKLRVYFSDTMRHKAPHVHVYIGNESVAVVALVSQSVLAGSPIGRKARQLIASHIDELWDAWDRCNG